MRKKIFSMLLVFCVIFSAALPVFATQDSYEPNDDMYSSVTIPAYYFPITATLDTSTDLDWYDFQAYGTGYLTLKLVPPAGKNYDFLVFYQGKLIGRGDTKGSGEAEQVTIPVTKDRSYVCMVASPNGDFSDSTYSFGKDQFTSTYDAAYESNNTPGDAAYIDLYNGSTIGAAIDSSSDVDYYIFRASNTGSIDIGLIGPYTRNYDLYVIDKLSGSVVGESHLGTGQTEHAICNVVKDREYYIVVYGATSSDYYSGIPYQLFKAN